jgi:hypothetical protein
LKWNTQAKFVLELEEFDPKLLQQEKGKAKFSVLNFYGLETCEGMDI